MLLFQTVFQAPSEWVGEATVADVGEHRVLIRFPLIKQAGSCRTSRAFVRGGTEVSHASSMAAGARNTSTGTGMGSHPPSLLVAPFLKWGASSSPSSLLGAPRLVDVCTVFKDPWNQNLLKAQTKAGILNQPVQTVNRTLTFDREGVIGPWHCWDSHSGQKSFLHTTVQLKHQVQPGCRSLLCAY